MTPEQRSLRARVAAHRRWAMQDARLGTEAARRGFMTKFEDQVDPDRVLPVAERTRRAESAMKAHMAGLALKSSMARSRSRPEHDGGPVAPPRTPAPRHSRCQTAQDVVTVEADDDKARGTRRGP